MFSLDFGIRNVVVSGLMLNVRKNIFIYMTNNLYDQC